MDAPLDVAELIQSVTDPEAGALASFIGTVRVTAADGANSKRRVVGLEYEAHPDLAPPKLEEIARAAVDRWELIGVVAVHRAGTCQLGDPTVLVACSAPHREAALTACRWIIDEIKRSVPIWKKEIFDDDGSAWVGMKSLG